MLKFLPLYGKTALTFAWGLVTEGQLCHLYTPDVEYPAWCYWVLTAGKPVLPICIRKSEPHLNMVMIFPGMGISIMKIRQ